MREWVQATPPLNMEATRACSTELHLRVYHLHCIFLTLPVSLVYSPLWVSCNAHIQQTPHSQMSDQHHHWATCKGKIRQKAYSRLQLCSVGFHGSCGVMEAMFLWGRTHTKTVEAKCWCSYGIFGCVLWLSPLLQSIASVKPHLQLPSAVVSSAPSCV